jgi:7,8-dihydropterin-6-yl-methyl-4-(beta-D-ribofuranosyl)aminobenzene 5'-phosphate synthase
MLRITTLVENSQGEHKGLIHEHGLSFHIDNGGNCLLFDTGQSDALIRNAAKLRINLAEVHLVVLSHGHYDHSGGLRALAAQASGFGVVTGPGFFNDKYGDLGTAYEFLGNDFDVRWLADNGIAHATLEEPVREVAPGVHALTDFPRRHADEKINPRFKVRVDGAFVEDTFADEVMLAVDSPRGLVAVLGCSHPGVKNMLDAAVERLGKPIHAVIGGTHLVEASPESLALTIEYLRRNEIAVIGASHCTGAAAMDRLAAFDGRYYRNGTGTALIIE